MPTDLNVHEFDGDRASRFTPRPSFVKTAVLVVVVDPEAVTRIRTPFGEQSMRGSFYVVAEGNGSYGAARAEFEASHVEVEPGRWIKSEPVVAYQVDEASAVVTELASGRESVVEARPGDWVVRQNSGEAMTIRPDEFNERYEPADG